MPSAAHRDRQRHKKTFITAASSPFKVEGNVFEPLSTEARADIQGKVDAYQDVFVGSVARGRRVPFKTGTVLFNPADAGTALDWTQTEAAAGPLGLAGARASASA